MCMRTIKNAREHCVHVTDHSGWRFSTTHVMKYLHFNYCMRTCGSRINANSLKKGSFHINAKLVKEELINACKTIILDSAFISFTSFD